MYKNALLSTAKLIRLVGLDNHNVVRADIAV